MNKKMLGLIMAGVLFTGVAMADELPPIGEDYGDMIGVPAEPLPAPGMKEEEIPPVEAPAPPLAEEEEEEIIPPLEEEVIPPLEEEAPAEPVEDIEEILEVEPIEPIDEIEEEALPTIEKVSPKDVIELG